eukprot:14650191-Alexandrium_andersonii.AAC.1
MSRTPLSSGATSLGPPLTRPRTGNRQQVRDRLERPMHGFLQLRTRGPHSGVCVNARRAEPAVVSLPRRRQRLRQRPRCLRGRGRPRARCPDD